MPSWKLQTLLTASRTVYRRIQNILDEGVNAHPRYLWTTKTRQLNWHYSHRMTYVQTTNIVVAGNLLVMIGILGDIGRYVDKDPNWHLLASYFTYTS
jgi:hypothetical protein